MGIYDRGYYDGDQWKGGSGNESQFGRSAFKGSMISVIIGINVIVFLLDMFSPKVTFQRTVELENGQQEVQKQPTNSQTLSVALALKNNMSDLGHPGPLENPLYAFQVLTHGFAHASIGDDFGFLHIAFNMLVLFMLGLPVEQKIGKDEFLKFYIAALLFAGLGWLLIKSLSNQPNMAVGASGAVAAVVFLFVFNFPKKILMFMGVVPMRAWVLGVIFVAIDIFNSMDSESRIAVEAHLSGVAFAAMYHFWKFNFSWLKTNWLTNRLSGKPRLKVHHGSEEPDEELTKQADIVLDKVHRLGEHSLTRKERKILNRYSRMVRKGRDD